MSNLALNFITLVLIVWCSLTAYVGYAVVQEKDVSDTDYYFGMSCMIVAMIMIVLFGGYVYSRTGSELEQAVVLGFRWVDAVVLVVLFAWCLMSIAISSVLITYREQKGDVSSTDRNVAISTIVLAVVVLLQYVVFLFVQGQLPTWCTQYAAQRKAEKQLLEELFGGESRSNTDSKQTTVQPIVIQLGGIDKADVADRKKRQSF